MNSTINKWITINKYIDIETGECFEKLPIPYNYTIQETTKEYKINGNHATRIITNYIEQDRQQKLF